MAIEKGLIDWDNYEAKHSFFPTRFRGSVKFPHLAAVITTPRSLRVKINENLIDAVYTWQMPPQMPLRRRLRKSYERVERRLGGELWLRRADQEEGTRSISRKQRKARHQRERAAASSKPMP
jgi:hypothetical protein